MLVVHSEALLDAEAAGEVLGSGGEEVRGGDVEPVAPHDAQAHVLEGLLLDLRKALALPEDPVPLGGWKPGLLPGGPTRAQVRQVAQGHAQPAAHEGRVHQLRVE